MKATRYLFLLMFICHFQASGQLPDLGCSLSVNGSLQVDIRPAYPVILEFTLFSLQEITAGDIMQYVPDSIRNTPLFQKKMDSLGKGYSVGSATNPWYKDIIFEFSSKNNRKAGKVPRELINPMPLKSGIVATGHSLRANFGIDPAYTKRWKEGEIQVRAGYLHQGGGDTLWAKRVMIRIKGISLKKPADYTDEQLYFTADYWLRRGACAKAGEYVSEMLARNPASYPGTALMGEVKLCNHDLTGALDFYHKAVEAFEKEADADMKPPTHLLYRIREIERELDKK